MTTTTFLFSLVLYSAWRENRIQNLLWWEWLLPFFFLSRTPFSMHGKPLAYNLLFYLYLYHEDLPQVLQFISIWHSRKVSICSFFFPNLISFQMTDLNLIMIIYRKTMLHFFFRCLEESLDFNNLIHFCEIFYSIGWRTYWQRLSVWPSSG